MSMAWPGYLKKVYADSHHSVVERCDHLDVCTNAFNTHGSLSKMKLGLRKAIAGLPTPDFENTAWFGSMTGNITFRANINNNEKHLSSALDLIPSFGPVTKDDYLAYIDEFKLGFPNGRDGIGVATRLIAMKRPDQFLCLDSANKATLCEDFGIKQGWVKPVSYWDEIIARIVDSPWWNVAPPKDPLAKRVWNGRAAMLDAIFYEPT